MNLWGWNNQFFTVVLALIGMVSGIMTIHSFLETHQHPKVKQQPVTVSMIVISLIFVLSLFLTPVAYFAGRASTATMTQVTPTPTFTQSGPIDLTPDGDSYGHKINSWSKPAYNGYCQLPDCDPTSKRVDMLTEGTVVTAICWTYGQMVITGTVTNPGYKDIRWIRLEDGTYLPNTWFMRDRLSQQLSRC